MLLAASLFTKAQTPASAPPHPANTSKNPPEVHAITEEQLRHQLQGKSFYLRSGYFDNELRFDQVGNLDGSSPKVPYTLSMVQIDKVSLGKRKLELTGVRYGIHFLGASPTEDPLTASDKVRITPKKKVLKITIERAEVVKPKVKKQKPSKDSVGLSSKNGPQTASAETPNPSDASDAAPAITMTQERANKLLEGALDRILSPGLDERMIASLPDFWQVYYHAAASKTDYKPGDPSVFRQNTVDQKARLITNFEPPSNDMAQMAGVAGVALYHVVVGRDGKPAEIAVGRPIGFGLDENAVDSIRKATFQPAMKDGKPVPVFLDLLVEFRIFSKRTAAGGNGEAASAKLSEPEAPSLPGPYSAPQTPTKQQ